MTNNGHFSAVVQTQCGGHPIEIDVFSTMPTYAFVEIGGGVAKLNHAQIDSLMLALLDAYCFTREAQEEQDLRAIQKQVNDMFNKAFQRAYGG